MKGYNDLDVFSLTARRDKAARLTKGKKCPCGTDQIQLISWFDQYRWRCRRCKKHLKLSEMK